MNNLKEFIKTLEKKGELVRIDREVSTYLEITEISKRVIEKKGPALLFENVITKSGTKANYPILTNLFSTRNRILLGLNKTEEEYLELGETLAFLRNPKPVKGFKEIFKQLPLLKKIMAMKTKEVKGASCQEITYLDDDINIYDLPMQYCWPGEPAPLITYGTVITRGPNYLEKTEDCDDYNLGIYRLQPIAKDKLIMRWLHHRGGAQHFLRWRKANPGKDMPVAIAIGLEPALLLSSVIPLPDNLSEYKFSGLLKGTATEVVKAKTSDLLVPANAEFIIEGYVSANEEADEGPYGDHTGFYNSVEKFPVVKITAITSSKNPVYLSTYTGRPIDEPAVLSETLNDLLVPLLKAHLPEVVDFYLIPDACSYRMGVVSIKKLYEGQAKRVAFGIWSFLRQFVYTKTLIVIDEDLDVRSNSDLMWALSTNIDPVRDVTIIPNTPMDYLDFSSEKPNLASKMLIDATTKIGSETSREWGKKLFMDEVTIKKVDTFWQDLEKDIFKK